MDIDTIRKHPDQDNIGCPMMEFATIQLDIFPLEKATLNQGIGCLPYILDLRADEITMPL